MAWQEVLIRPVYPDLTFVKPVNAWDIVRYNSLYALHKQLRVVCM